MAAKTKLSDLGSQVCVDDENEHLIPALGNGTAVPGDLCGITSADGKVKGTDEGAVNEFLGILKESKITGTETAIVAGVKCSLIVPKSGHRYRIRILDTVDTQDVGFALDFSGTPYKADAAASINVAKMVLSLPCYQDDDTIVEVIWL